MKKRIISAIVMVAIFTPLLIIGKLPFEIGLSVIAALSLKEIMDLMEKEKKLPLLIKILSYLSVVLLVMSSSSLFACIGLIVLFIFIPIIFIKDDEYNFNDAIKLFGIILFIGICFYLMNLVRLSSIEEFIYLILITILTDSFAYIGGKLLGKHKLIVRVSPNKTIEGSVIGSMIGTLIPSFVYLFFVDPDINIVVLILMTLIISIFGQIGDLLFSTIKRHFKVKDYSNLIPGHGGILDRFDSITIATLVYIIIKTIFL